MPLTIILAHCAHVVHTYNLLIVVLHDYSVRNYFWHHNCIRICIAASSMALVNTTQYYNNTELFFGRLFVTCKQHSKSELVMLYVKQHEAICNYCKKIAKNALVACYIYAP